MKKGKRKHGADFGGKFSEVMRGFSGQIRYQCRGVAVSADLKCPAMPDWPVNTNEDQIRNISQILKKKSKIIKLTEL